jgi:glycerol uptake facilitator-like aquaporin
MLRSTKAQIQSLFAEFLCTFIFGYAVYSAILNVKNGEYSVTDVYIPLAVGFSGIVCIYTFLDHTICHFNPAITLGAIITMKLPIVMGIFYIISQFLGFVIACCVVKVNFSQGWKETMKQLAPNRVDPDLSNTALFFTEFTLTAILVFVAFENGVNSKRNSDDSLYGDTPQPDRSIVAPLVIGLTLGFLAILGSTSSGGAFNPGLIFAPQLLGNVWSAGWEYYVGDFTGGIVGALIQVWVLFK